MILSPTSSQMLPWNPASLPTQTSPSCMYAADTDLAAFVNHCSFHSSPLPLSFCFFSLFSSNRLSLPPSFFYCCLLPHPSLILFLSQSDWVKMSMKCEAMLPYPTSNKLREVMGGKRCNFRCKVTSFPGYSGSGMRLDKQLFS